MAKFEILRSPKNRQYYWHLLGGNGEIMAQSEGYTSRWAAKRGAKRFAKIAASAPVMLQIK